ncbi:unnamed protein product [Boreogadus saida]
MTTFLLNHASLHQQALSQSPVNTLLDIKAEETRVVHFDIIQEESTRRGADPHGRATLGCPIRTPTVVPHPDPHCGAPSGPPLWCPIRTPTVVPHPDPHGRATQWCPVRRDQSFTLR